MAVLKTQRYGWLPDLPDNRDYVFLPKIRWKLPKQVDLRDRLPTAYDQANLGSCTAFATAAAMVFLMSRKEVRNIIPTSKLFIYYNSRVIEDSVDDDAGAMIRSSVKAVVNYGICQDDLWPYDVDRFAERPPEICYKEGLDFQALSYYRLPPSIRAMRGCLADGFPFIFGMSIYDGFESTEVAASGHLNLPSPRENLIGGHALLCVGYADDTQQFLIRNSWGEEWGIKGYFWAPYEYLGDSNLSDDRWCIRRSKIGQPQVILRDPQLSLAFPPM